MKVIHIHFGKDGGAERFFVNLANSLAERGVEQRFVIRPGRVWRSEIESCGEILKDNYRRISLSRYWLQWKLGKWLDEFKPDAIVSWMSRASPLLPRQSDAVRITRLGDYPNSIKPFSNCDVLVGNVPGIGEHCRKMGWDKRVEIVSNFTKFVTPVPVSRAEFDTPEDAFVISSAGRFVHRKGMDALIQAAAKLDNAWLWLVGDGKEKSNLIALAKQVGIDERLRFIGWQNEPAPFLAASDVFCMPSRHEPLGNVVLEAWTLDLPVVSSRSEGPSWFMRDGKNGLLVEIDDIDGFANAFNRLRSNPDLCSTVIAGGNHSLDGEFSKKAITDQYINLFSGKTGLFPL
ncbi:MAG: glycosyltransferase [Hyphomicrobiales bacterium]|nr:glycosyltransferase [Hyphomicrobiales bacterium]